MLTKLTIVIYSSICIFVANFKRIAVVLYVTVAVRVIGFAETVQIAVEIILNRENFSKISLV